MDQPNVEKQSLAQEEVIPKPECMFCRQQKHDENLKAFPCTYSTIGVLPLLHGLERHPLSE